MRIGWLGEMGLGDVKASLYARILLAVADRVASDIFPASRAGGDRLPVFDPLALTWVQDGTLYGWRARPGSGEAAVPVLPDELPKGTLALHLGILPDAIAFFEGRRSLPSRLGSWWRPLAWMRMLRLLAAAKARLDPVKQGKAISDAETRLKVETGMYAACCGVSALVSMDPFCARLSSEQPSGRLRVFLAGYDAPLAILGIRHDRWVMNPSPTEPYEHEVDLVFRDGMAALQSVSGRLDNLAAVGDGRIRMSGFVPLADGFTHMTDRLQQFVRTA